MVKHKKTQFKSSHLHLSNKGLKGYKNTHTNKNQTIASEQRDLCKRNNMETVREAINIVFPQLLSKKPLETRMEKGKGKHDRLAPVKSLLEIVNSLSKVCLTRRISKPLIYQFLIILLALLLLLLLLSQIPVNGTRISYKNLVYIQTRGMKKVAETAKDGVKKISTILDQASPEHKEVLTASTRAVLTTSASDRQALVYKYQLSSEHYNHYNQIYASVKTIIDNPAAYPSVTILQMYARGIVNINIQSWQNTSNQLLDKGIIKSKVNIVEFLENPGKYHKELSEIIAKNPNSIDEMLSVNKLPITVDIRYCSPEFRKIFEKYLKDKFEFVNETNNTDVDCIILSKGKAIAVDIKRINNLQTGITYDEIHTIPADSAKTKVSFCLNKMVNVVKYDVSQFNDDAEKAIARQKLISKITRLQDELNSLTSGDILKKYNELVCENLETIKKCNLNFTFIVSVDLSDFYLPPDVVLEHQKHYQNAQNFNIIEKIKEEFEKNNQGALQEINQKTNPQDLIEKKVSFNDKGFISAIIEYAQNTKDEP